MPSANLVEISNLFSNARNFGEIWNSQVVRVHYLFVGYWDHPGLEAYYYEINASFPYTVGHNYLIWAGISADEMTMMVNNRLPTESQIPFGQVLYELTAGHPGAALDILNEVERNNLSISALLSATRRAVRWKEMWEKRLLNYCLNCRQNLGIF